MRNPLWRRLSGFGLNSVHWRRFNLDEHEHGGFVSECARAVPTLAVYPLASLVATEGKLARPHLYSHSVHGLHKPSA